MKKLIDFKTLKSVCGFEYPLDKLSDCDHEKSKTYRCNSKDCPVWNKLKEK